MLSGLTKTDCGEGVGGSSAHRNKTLKDKIIILKILSCAPRDVVKRVMNTAISKRLANVR